MTPPMTRRRADVVLAERGLFPSRHQARAAILAGEVSAAGRQVTKAGELLDDDVEIEIAERPRYVSRGGLKLEGALESLGIDVRGARAVDVGASTGGFTDCLLQAGAASVVAIDVGYGQLAWSLRTDDRVTVVERTNIRSVDPDTVGAPFDLVVVDVSFIGLAAVLPHVESLLAEEGDVLLLVKPQFEAGKERVGRKGVVRAPDVHTDVLRSVLSSVREVGLYAIGLTFSPIAGPEGNIEFWVRADRGGPEADVRPEDVVQQAHRALEV
jgi:23S rRNA (cytidine1920-2'-O)/16S rRNA (cytidine1409-2'-O)-methyltransferase